MLHALVKVVVLPLSSTGITTSCQAIYMASEIRDQECGQPALASTSALAGPAVPATRARPSMAPAAKRSSPSKAVVVVDAFARSGHEATSWVSSVLPLGSAAPSKSWNHVLTQDGWRSPDTALCFQMHRATKSRPASVLPWATKTLCRLRRPKPATSDRCQLKVCIAAACTQPRLVESCQQCCCTLCHASSCPRSTGGVQLRGQDG